MLNLLLRTLLILLAFTTAALTSAEPADLDAAWQDYQQNAASTQPHSPMVGIWL